MNEMHTADGFDALLVLGLKAAIRREWDEMAAEAEAARDPDSPGVSRALDKRVRAAILRQGPDSGGTERERTRAKSGRRAVLFAFAALLALFLLGMTVRPIRQELARIFLLDRGETYRFSAVRAPGEDCPETLLDPKEPDFAPEGMNRTELYRTPYALGIVYADERGNRIFLSQHIVPEDPYEIVNANPDVQPVKIGGEEYNGVILSDPKGISFNFLIWTDGEYLYTLNGTAGPETLLRMAESLRGSPASGEARK